MEDGHSDGEEGGREGWGQKWSFHVNKQHWPEAPSGVCPNSFSHFAKSLKEHTKIL